MAQTSISGARRVPRRYRDSILPSPRSDYGRKNRRKRKGGETERTSQIASVGGVGGLKLHDAWGAQRYHDVSTERATRTDVMITASVRPRAREQHAGDHAVVG